MPALKDEAFVADGRSRRFNLKKVLVVAEVALSLLLLIAAGLFIKSLKTVETIDAGLAVDELVTAPLSVNLLRYTRAQGREFYQRVIDRMEQMPGVKSASVARVAVLTGGARVTSVNVEGRADRATGCQSEGGGFAPSRASEALATSSVRASSRRSAFRSSRAATSTARTAKAGRWSPLSARRW